MRAADLHAMRQALAADDRQEYGFPAIDAVDLIPRLQRFAADIGPEARLFRQAHRLSRALALGLAIVQKALIVLAVGGAVRSFLRTDARAAVFRRVKQRLRRRFLFTHDSRFSFP